MSVVLNATNFPDYGFREYLKQLLSKNIGDTISDTEITNLTSIAIDASYRVKDVTGIENFTYLESIVLILDSETSSFNSFSFNLSGFQHLTSFRLYAPTLTSLNLIPSTILEIFEIEGCRYLTNFDFREYTNIQSIKVSYNVPYNDPERNVSIIASNLSHLVNLFFEGGSYSEVVKLSVLDLTGSLSNFERLDIYRAKLSSPILDLSGYSHIKYVTLHGLNTLNSVILNSSYLTTVDIRNCYNLNHLDFGVGKSTIKYLYLWGNGDGLKDSLDISECINLFILRIFGVAYKNIDITNIPRLMHAYIDTTQDLPSIRWRQDGPNIWYQYIHIDKAYNAGYSPIQEDIQDTVDYVLEYDPECNIITNYLTIEDEPEDQYCNIDENALFHCAVANGQNVEYEWQYRNFKTNCASSEIINWTKISDSSDLSVLTRPGVEYNAYRCKVVLANSKRKYSIKDKNGSITGWEYRYHIFHYTDSVHIKVYYPLKIETEPQSIITLPGEVARFHVEASNDAPDIISDDQTTYHPDRSGPEIQYQWQIFDDNEEDYVDIDNENIATFSIIANNSLNGNKYRCSVSDGRTSLLSNEVILTVTDNITIETQPQSLTVYEIDPAVFSVEATGGSIRYQWEKLENNIWVSISGEISSTYSISETSLSDNGLTLRCHLSNGAADVYTTIVTLTVQKRPLSIVVQPQSITIMEGKNGNLSVRAAGDGLTYQWQYLSGSNEWVDLRYQIESIFTFVASMAMNGQQYRCVVIDEDQNSVLSNAATITVTADPSLAPPTIVEQPSSQQVSDGNTATFFIVVSGEDLFYQWQTFKDGIWYSISGANAASYDVGANRLLNNAQFRCQVSNPIGSVYSNIVRLSVTSGSDISTPSIRIQPRSAFVQEGVTASFSVGATGGSLNYQWQVKRNGQWYNITGATNSVYMTIARSSNDGEQYRCLISNIAGSIYSNIVQLNVETSGPLDFYGYHSIIISGKNTYGEWEMYPTSRPHVAPPEVKTSYIDVPGANGGLDYTDLLTGDPRYGYRKGSWEFLLIPQEKWPDVYRSLCNYLHGKIHKIVLEDDPTWQYTGRLQVNQWKSEQHNSLITIDYVLDPIPVNLEDETYDQDTDDLELATRILRKSANEGKVLALINNQAALIDPESYFENGDSILY